jgi:hypothetical protein
LHSRSTGRRRLSSRLFALALLCAGALYTGLSFTSNVLIMQAKSWRDTRPDIAMAKIKLAAALFPVQPQFREAPAYYAIYAESRGLMSSTEALEETAKVLDFNRNSLYLSSHLVRLLRESMK